MVMLPKIPKTKEHLDRLAKQPQDSSNDQWDWLPLAVFVSLAAFVLVIVEASVSAYNYQKHEERLQRLELIERIDSIGRRY